VWVLPESQSSQILISPSPSRHGKEPEHIDGQGLGLQKPLFAGTDYLGWKSHAGNQNPAFTLNTCAFEVKTDCRLQLWHE